jgi:hypothetical protein
LKEQIKSEGFDIPILFIIFNRPDTTEKVFEKIRAIKPKYLYVSSDGARTNKIGEKEMCEAAKEIINGIDWDCELKTNYSEINCGCKTGIGKGIHWFFENVECGIILEADCVPDLSFFNFCKVMLEKYKDDKRIMFIGGSNFQGSKKRGQASYYFSKHCHSWGWAMWKDRWNKYDANMSDYNDDEFNKLVANVTDDKGVRNYYKRFFGLVKNNIIDTWDFQWTWTMWKNNGLSIVPNINLIKNIGFRKDAVHCTSPISKLANIKTGNLSEIIFNDNVQQDKEADRYAYYHKIKQGKFEKLVAKIYQLLN